MNTPGRHIVCGLGGSGEAASLLLKSEGADVTVLDEADNSSLRIQAENLEKRGIRVLLGVSAPPDGDFESCVVSPGVPLDSHCLAELRRRNVPLVSELELGWSRRGKSRVVAVTGSNGKSTVVKWFAEALNSDGRSAAPAGNYGPAISRIVREQPELEWIVAEVSSFQLETVRRFRAETAILLNIHPNHLDRHGDMQTYKRAKARLFSQTAPGDVCVVHEDHLDEMKNLSGGRGLWISFGLGENCDYRYADGKVFHGERMVVDLSDTMFANEVLGQAAAAVAAGLEACGANPEKAAEAARGFKPLPHRMERVGEIDGIRFVNDSKATNLTAMAAALRMSEGRVRLIAGGLVKEKDFSFVKEVLAKKALAVYLIGKASEAMASAWSDVVPCRLCGTLDVAVARAKGDAKRGETVLLSPACASFDQFRNFEERGRVFAALVGNLVKQ